LVGAALVCGGRGGGAETLGLGAAETEEIGIGVGIFRKQIRNAKSFRRLGRALAARGAILLADRLSGDEPPPGV
jgi:hypothetical protein